MYFVDNENDKQNHVKFTMILPRSFSIILKLVDFWRFFSSY